VYRQNSVFIPYCGFACLTRACDHTSGPRSCPFPLSAYFDLPLPFVLKLSRDLLMAKKIDKRFTLSDDFNKSPLAGSSKLMSEEAVSRSEHLQVRVSEQDSRQDDIDGLGEGMDAHGFSGPKIVKPLTPEALAAFRAAQETAGVIYISRIPPGMQPTKVRHLMSQYGEVGRVYLQKEGVDNMCS